jgi:hypothetical protein
LKLEKFTNPSFGREELTDRKHHQYVNIQRKFHYDVVLFQSSTTLFLIFPNSAAVTSRSSIPSMRRLEGKEDMPSRDSHSVHKGNNGN